MRFPTLRELRHRYGPRVIVCTGKTFRDDFAGAFGFDGEPHHIDISYITPLFGGRYGINSNALLVELARTIESELASLQA